MDWLTALIVLVGLVILGLWVIVPIAEFREIFRKLRAEPANKPSPSIRDVKETP